MVPGTQVHALRLAATRRRLGERLRRASVPDADRTAGWLLGYLTGLPVLALEQHGEDLLAPEAVETVEELAARVAAGTPVQYVLGTVDFMGLELAVDERVLIPRPETEQLVEQVLARERGGPGVEGTVVDVGTGSGCIALALARAWPRTRLVATDLSAGALDVARGNAGSLGLEGRVSFVQDDLLENWAGPPIDLLVSNPPYIATPALAGLDPVVADHEPRPALDGGDDGLRVIARLLDQGYERLGAGGRLYLEIGDEQGSGVAELMHKIGYSKVTIEHDLNGRDRFALGVKP